MKIDTDLRAAIRAALNVQKRNHSNRWEVRRERTSAAIKKLISKPHVASQVNAAQRVLAKGRALEKAAQDSLFSLGIHPDLDAITHEENFTQAGGILPVSEGKLFNFDDIMARLAAASEKDGHAILELLGIKWD